MLSEMEDVESWSNDGDDLKAVDIAYSPEGSATTGLKGGQLRKEKEGKS